MKFLFYLDITYLQLTILTLIVMILWNRNSNFFITLSFRCCFFVVEIQTAVALDPYVESFSFDLSWSSQSFYLYPVQKLVIISIHYSNNRHRHFCVYMLKNVLSRLWRSVIEVIAVLSNSAAKSPSFFFILHACFTIIYSKAHTRCLCYSKLFNG